MTDNLQVIGSTSCCI